MNYWLLLVNGQGEATTSQLRIRTLREFPGTPELSVHFRPVRNDLLLQSAKAGGALAYRILLGEGIIRHQLWVEYEVLGEHVNVMGHSSDLLFALALITTSWSKPVGAEQTIAATGVLASDGTVQSVDHTVEKITAAVRRLEDTTQAVIFYPATEVAIVEAWCAQAEIPTHIQLRSVRSLEEALAFLGYELEKVYLRNPFRGLEHFEYEHRSIFFGRDGEVREVLAQLLRRESSGNPGLLVEGPSGSGKSSFTRAGVIPALIDPRHQPEAAQKALDSRPISLGLKEAIWQPGLLPTHADEQRIVSSICDCWATFSDFTPGWREAPLESFAEFTQRRRNHWPATRRFVWFIDQFEELFTLGLADSLLDGFGRFLEQLQIDGGWTLASIRTDAVPELKRHVALRRVFGANEGQYYLTTLGGLAIDDVIVLPAKAAGLTFGVGPDGRPLDQVLREEAYREHDSLPLLQFTLNELYMKRFGNELTYSTYQQLGGLSGSIATTAQAVLTMEGEEMQRATQRLFRSLVSVDDTGRATRRYAPTAEIAVDLAQKELVGRLITARLCVTDQRDRQSVVAFAHDSLLRTLPPLIDWLKREAGLLQARELAQRETRLWQQHGESDAWLASADKLVTFKSLAAAEIFLTDSVRQFVSTSERRVRRTMRIKQLAVAVIAMLGVVASIAAVIATTKQKEAEYQTALTVEAQKRSLTEAAAARLRDGDLPYARRVITEVLKNEGAAGFSNAAAVNVFQDVRARDPLRVVIAGPVTAAQYSPIGDRILTSSFIDRTSRFWDARTGVEVSVVIRNKQLTPWASYSRDGTQIVVSGDDSIQILDANSGKQTHVLENEGKDLGSARFSQDGSRVVAAVGKAVRIWDVSSGTAISTFAVKEADVFYADFSPDSARIAATLSDNTVRIMDARSGAPLATLSGHNATIAAVAFSPDGTKVVTASLDGTSRIWNSRSGEALFVLAPNTAQMYVATFSPDGKMVATGSTDKLVRLWDVATGAELRSIAGHRGVIRDVSFSADGSHLVSVASDDTARVWDLRSSPGAVILGGTASPAQVNDFAFSPDGTKMATTSTDGVLRIWDALSGKQFAIIPARHDATGDVVYSPDGTRILTTSDDNKARLLDARTYVSVRELTGPEGLACATFSPDSKHIAARHDLKSLGIWDADTGLSLAVWPGHPDITYVSYSPDGKSIVTTSLDGTARIWDARLGTQKAILPHADFLYSAVYSRDGGRILTSSLDETARIWRADDGAPLITMSGHRSPLFDAEFSPDGRRVATASKDYGVRIWDAQTGIQLASLRGHTDRVAKVAYSPDGQHLVSMSRDKTVRIWDARVQTDLASQILWAQAAEPEPLSEVELRGLGLSPTGMVVSRESTTGSACDREAASFYDPDRRAPGVEQIGIKVDIAKLACLKDASTEASTARSLYETGRALRANGDFAAARESFEKAVSKGYRAAGIDLAMLLSDPSAKMLDRKRAQDLYVQAWNYGVPIAAFLLGQLYEYGVVGTIAGAGQIVDVDLTKAWQWYQRGADVQEPNALARFAQRDERDAVSTKSRQAGNTLALGAFKLYTRAAERARTEDWPENAWKDWSYHRATLARVLAAEGLMQQAADTYKDELNKIAPYPRSFGEKIRAYLSSSR